MFNNIIGAFSAVIQHCCGNNATFFRLIRAADKKSKKSIEII